MHRSRLSTLLLLPLLAACGGADAGNGEGAADSSAQSAAETPTDAYWANLGAQCGMAYPGKIAIAPPDDDMVLPEDNLIVYFDHCSEGEIRLPFHIEKVADGVWDRSRTWIYRRTDDGRIELRHDHRIEDGSEDRNTWYGAFSGVENGAEEPNMHEYIREGMPPQQVEGQTPQQRGWRVIIEPGVRYVYGTIRDGEWRWRVDFDLSSPLDAPPPPAWGYEDGKGPLR